MSVLTISEKNLKTIGKTRIQGKRASEIICRTFTLIPEVSSSLDFKTFLPRVEKGFRDYFPNFHSNPSGLSRTFTCIELLEEPATSRGSRIRGLFWIFTRLEIFEKPAISTRGFPWNGLEKGFRDYFQNFHSNHGQPF